MDNEDAPSLNFNGKRYELGRDNTALYTYLGKYAYLNHVFVDLQQEPPLYTYAFAEDELYQQLRDLVEREQYPQMLNQNDPQECDLSAYAQRHMTDLEAATGVPEEWLEA